MTQAILGTVVVGGGPASMGILIAASKHGRLRDLARTGFAIVSKDERLGPGTLTSYSITSDSTAETLLTAVADHAEPSVAALANGPEAAAVASYIGALGVPLRALDAYLTVLADRLLDALASHGGRVLLKTEVLWSRRTESGLWRTRVRSLVDGREEDLLSRALVSATGAHQPIETLQAETVGGARLAALAGDRLVPSDTVVSRHGFAQIRDRLDGIAAPRIAVVGGSTSALSSVTTILNARPALALATGAVTLLHRRKLVPFYFSADAARADGFHDFSPDDICPVSGFVYRFAGARLESRELVLDILGIGGRKADPRLALHRIAPGTDESTQAIIAEADLVVAALGYRPCGMALHEADGTVIALQAHLPGHMPLVDERCRVLDGNGAPIPGVFGIGLAAGFMPRGRLGGEPSFVGQVNSLWLWQNDIGLMIADQLIDRMVEAA